MNKPQSETRIVTNLCVSSADSSFVFGPLDKAEWRVTTSNGGNISGTPDERLIESLRATAESHNPRVHITCDCEGQLYHGPARVISLNPQLEFEIDGALVPA